GDRAPRRRARHPGDAERRPQVRALLALPRRCRRRCGPSDAVRALRGQSLRERRGAPVRMSQMNTAAHDARAGARHWWTWLLVSAAVIAADQLSKSLGESALRVGEQRALNPNFSIVLAYNTGAAFSFLADASGWQRYLFTALALAASALMVWLLRRGGNRVYSQI